MMLGVILAMAMSMAVFAESGGASGTANNAVVGAMTTVANDMVATGNAVIPVALTVVGIALVVIFGIRMFKKVVNK